MNLESVGVKIRDTVWNSVWPSNWYSVWNSVFDPVRNSVWDSLNIGLQEPIREERGR